ncbi:SDR family NAD(P)-dependent oxidoreductase [Janibacter alittae]|uniref:SDR family NAD(P)-dependent oxidoreductase n=1 Tax=Janibacter alittae TaxID=3115209 RepID=A0ABZ2MGX7_9MICO
MTSLALVVGAGSGLSAAIARALAHRSYHPILVARDISTLDALRAEVDGTALQCDASVPDSVAELFETIDGMDGSLDVAVYNPSPWIRGSITELDPLDVREVLEVTAFGAFLVAQHAAGRMLNSGGGTMLFTGASSSVKGYPESAPYAMGKFAVRGMCQSLARELHPQNIHIAHVVIDGRIGRAGEEDTAASLDETYSPMVPDEIARNYIHMIEQDRSAWSWEIELRPWVRHF